MEYQRIHITGASGSGTTTLGKALAKKMGVPLFDTDDYFWSPSKPPFQKKREKKKRQKLLMADLKKRQKWILSGSLCGWGDITIPLFDLVIFLWVPTEVRIERLKKREIERFGEDALFPSGEMYENHRDFIAWASQYDEGGTFMRSLALHNQWLQDLDCPVIRFEGEKALEEIIEELGL